MYAATIGIGSSLLSAAIVTDSFAMPKDDGGWVYHYQTLIAGILALLAAVVGALLLHRQIRLSEEFV